MVYAGEEVFLGLGMHEIGPLVGAWGVASRGGRGLVEVGRLEGRRLGKRPRRETASQIGKEPLDKGPTL
jgi:hypothetical protein